MPAPNDFTRGMPFVDNRFREAADRKKARQREAGLETSYCAETVAITYEEIWLVSTHKRSNWFDAGSFWSGDTLPFPKGIGSATRFRSWRTRVGQRRGDLTRIDWSGTCIQCARARRRLLRDYVMAETMGNGMLSKVYALMTYS